MHEMPQLAFLVYLVIIFYGLVLGLQCKGTSCDKLQMRQ